MKGLKSNSFTVFLATQVWIEKRLELSPLSLEYPRHKLVIIFPSFKVGEEGHVWASHHKFIRIM
jgi:hypothetical protein